MQTEVVYLGLLSKIFNAIFNAILSPVFEFISKLLETVLGWIFDAVLQPLLVAVFFPLLKSVWDIIMEAFGEMFYGLLVSVLQIIDSMQDAFNIFAGLKLVTYKKSDPMSMLELIFRLDVVQRGVLIITAIALVLMFLFATIATVRSIFDMEMENRHTISKILQSSMKAFFRLFLIPVVCLFAIRMSGVILSSVNTAMGGDQTTLSRMIFVTASLDAARDDRYNTSSGNSDIGINDGLRKKYYTGEVSYANKDQVGKDFKFGKFDYLVGFGGCGFLIIILFIGILTFINRLFEVVILFIVSPFFASLMPLDDGEKFKTWQDMFVGKLFGGFGLVIAMELYMILVPIVMSGNISFGEGSTEANYLLRFVFLLGGAWATIKIGPMITQLLSFQAGGQEQMTAASAYGFVAGAGAMAAGLGSAAVNAYRGGKAARAGRREQSNERINERLGYGLSGGGSGGGGGRTQIQGRKPGSVKQGAPGSDGGFKANAATQKGSFMGGKITMSKTAEGKSRLGINTRALRIGTDENGRTRCQVFGFGSTTSADGQKKISLPMLRLKQETGADGKNSWRVAKVKLPAGIHLKRAETVTRNADGTTSHTFGKMYCSDVSAVGLKRRFDSDTGRVERLSLLGANYAKNAQGQYVKTHQTIFGNRFEYSDLSGGAAFGGGSVTGDESGSGNEYSGHGDNFGGSGGGLGGSPSLESGGSVSESTGSAGAESPVTESGGSGTGGSSGLGGSHATGGSGSGLGGSHSTGGSSSGLGSGHGLGSNGSGNRTYSGSGLFSGGEANSNPYGGSGGRRSGGSSGSSHSGGSGQNGSGNRFSGSGTGGANRSGSSGTSGGSGLPGGGETNSRPYGGSSGSGHSGGSSSGAGSSGSGGSGNSYSSGSSSGIGGSGSGHSGGSSSGSGSSGNSYSGGSHSGSGSSSGSGGSGSSHSSGSGSGSGGSGGTGQPNTTTRTRSNSFTTGSGSGASRPVTGAPAPDGSGNRNHNGRQEGDR